MRKALLFVIAIFGLQAFADDAKPSSVSPIKFSVARTWYNKTTQGASGSDFPCKDVEANVSVYEINSDFNMPNQPLLVGQCETELKNGEKVVLVIYGEKTVNAKTGWTNIDFNYRFSTSPKTQHLSGAATFYSIPNGTAGQLLMAGTRNVDEIIDGQTEFNININY